MEQPEASCTVVVIKPKPEHSRQNYEQRPEVRLKRHFKNTDPEYVKKRKLYSEKPQVKERRKILNDRRRNLCTQLITLLKKGALKVDLGGTVTSLDLKRGRLISGDRHVLTVNKKGVCKTIPFSTEMDLEDSKYDTKPLTNFDKEYTTLLETYEEYCLLHKLDMNNKDNLKSFLADRQDERRGKGDTSAGSGDSTEESQ